MQLSRVLRLLNHCLVVWLNESQSIQSAAVTACNPFSTHGAGATSTLF